MTLSTALAVPYPMLGAPQGEAETAAVAAVLTSGNRLAGGPVRDRFEEQLRDYLDAGCVATTPNCTYALWLATQTLDLRPGDEVVASSLTYQATVAPLLGIGVRVRFADIDPGTLNLDPDSVAAQIGPATRAVFVTHYGGNPAGVAAIAEIAQRHGIPVVEDAAHALGAHSAGRMAGTWGLGCFSFGSSKNLTTLGQGGAICVRDPSPTLLVAIEQLRSLEPYCDFRDLDHGGAAGTPLDSHLAPTDGILRHEKNAYTAECVNLRGSGFNGSLGEPACAAGGVQLSRVEEFNGRRREIAERLDAAVGSLGWASTQRVPADSVSSHHLYALLLDDRDVERDEFVRALAALGIEMQLRYFPAHLLPEWRLGGSGLGDCPVTEDVWFHRLVNLPIYPMLSDRQVEYMIEALPRAYRIARGRESVRTAAAELARLFGMPAELLPALR
ncbi:DegT/DnrJ/EryC1/StrS family aminotransferase [Plantactinospora sp. WMMB782]|uniref:DegT/DnrJ/EryC1/StrS family aminotransferase n=1 Tax=Plantactinospora sp. WMMB782 TaxID=3404121 RepID=UPI003B9610F2